MNNSLHYILPVNWAGFGSKLKIGLSNAGYSARLIEFQRNIFEYESDIIINSDSLINLEKKKIKLFFEVLLNIKYLHFTGARTIWQTNYFPPKNHNLKYYLFDLVHFFYSVLLQNIELTLYRIFKKRVFFYFLGGDIRIDSFCLKNFEYSIISEFDEKDFRKTDFAKKRLIKKFNKVATKLFAVNPDLMHNLPDDTIFLPIPFETKDLIKADKKNNLNPFVIGHAPSNRKIKGTKYIEDACKELVNKGYRIELRIYENLSNRNLREKFSEIDLFIDQLIGGWYGVVAMEALAASCPVVVYIRDIDVKYLPESMQDDLPFINANKNNLSSVIEEFLLKSYSEKQIYIQKGSKFLEKWHNPSNVIARISTFF